MDNSGYTATRSTGIPHQYKPKSLSSSTATSALISGRSLFDYAAPRTALNTPASRIYDGQLRRTVTARYVRNEPSISAINRREPNYDQARLKPITSAGSAMSNNGYKGTKLSQPTTLQVTTESKKVAVESKPITASQHLRSKSLKLRTSYGNILDHIASATFARLRLGSIGQNSHTSTPVASTNDLKEKQLKQQNRQTTYKQPTLEVVPDALETELEEPKNCLSSNCQRVGLTLATDHLTSKITDASSSATSPGSSSSGLSSSGLGLVCSSPTSSAPRSPVIARSTIGCQPNQLKSTDLRAIDSADDDSNNDSANCEYIGASEGSDESEGYNNEDEEQKTLISSGITRQNGHSVDEEAIFDPEEPVVRDNLLKTGAILAELDDFEENQALDQYSTDASCDELPTTVSSDEANDTIEEVKGVSNTNESVMVKLRGPHRVDDSASATTAVTSKLDKDESSEDHDPSDDNNEDDEEVVGEGGSCVNDGVETCPNLSNGNYVDQKVSCVVSWFASVASRDVYCCKWNMNTIKVMVLMCNNKGDCV